MSEITTVGVDLARTSWSATAMQACRRDVGRLGCLDPAACQALRFDPSSYHYKSRRTGQASLELRIREICETRVRYGYRRIHVLLRREGC